MYVRPENQYWFTRLPQKKRKHRNHPRFPRPMQNSEESDVPEQIGKIIAIDYKKKTVIVEWIKFSNDNTKIIRGIYLGFVNASNVYFFYAYQKSRALLCTKTFPKS